MAGNVMSITLQQELEEIPTPLSTTEPTRLILIIFFSCYVKCPCSAFAIVSL